MNINEKQNRAKLIKLRKQYLIVKQHFYKSFGIQCHLHLHFYTGVMPKDILKVYLSNVRSVLEYAVQVWQDIPAYLSDVIESIQRRALRIIFPNSSASARTN